MNFQNLKNVEKADSYLDVAFRAARTKEKPKVIKKSDRIKVIKTYEFQNIQTVTKSLTNNLRKIITSFPNLNELPDFYLELIKVTLDYPVLKKSLGAVSWAEKRVFTLYQNYSVKIKKAVILQKIINLKKEFYGRVSSVLKQINEELLYIEKSRKTMKGFPNIKTSLYSVAIAGYPNVGKSSLLNVMTSAKPEIKDYAFTTKSITIGYYKQNNTKIQLIDTPGAFDRELKDMNHIEKQSYLTLKHVAEVIVFIIDPTESCGYDIKQQEKLLFRIKSFNKKIIVVYNKADLFTDRDESKLYISTITNEGIDKLVKLAKKYETNRQNKDNQN